MAGMARETRRRLSSASRRGPDVRSPQLPWEPCVQSHSRDLLLVHGGGCPHPQRRSVPPAATRLRAPSMKVLVYAHNFAPNIGGAETSVMMLARGVGGAIGWTARSAR